MKTKTTPEKKSAPEPKIEQHDPASVPAPAEGIPAVQVIQHNDPTFPARRAIRSR